MRIQTAFKLGQIGGVLVMGTGVALFSIGGHGVLTPLRLLVLGGLVYAGCRIALWLREK
jgi:hypothetical protein